MGCKNDHAFCRHAFVKTPAGVPVAAKLVPVFGGKHCLQRHIQPAHDNRNARFEDDLRRIGVRVDVELCRGGYVAAGCRAAHDQNRMKKRLEFRIFGQRDGNVCEGTYGNEPKLARMLLCAIIQRVPRGGIVHDRIFGSGSSTSPRPFSP